MQYIIMCGGNDLQHWDIPRQLSIVNGEPIVARTIRLLKECGATDISISSNNSGFDDFGVPVIHHKNTYKAGGMWIEAFYPTDDPACYLMGDVVFSPEAIKKIVETETDDIEFFASAPPFHKDYFKPYGEPFAFKVVNQPHFKQALSKVREIRSQFRREPLAWELWQVIKGTPINHIDFTNYTVINDYTCDVDHVRDIHKFNALFDKMSQNH